MHNIDLKRFEVRTDMALDLIKETNNPYEIKNYVKNNIKISWMKLEENNEFKKKPGTYLTLEFNDVTDDDAKKNLSNVFKEELSDMLKKVGYSKDKKTLVVGLGNIKSTPDSLGPLVSEKVIVTKHLFDMKVNVDESFSNVSTFYPGVTGTTGIETSDLITGVIQKTKPDFLIMVDALSSSSISRVNKSIQVSTAGISPGSGIGNKRKEISKETLGIPVIAIGIPTVLDAVIIVYDTINYMIKNYSYNKKNQSSKANKFITSLVNYENKKVEVKEEEKKELLGMVGSLEDDELKKLIYEVLTPIGYNLMVTPKEIDFVIEKLSEVISYGINHSLHDI